MRKKIIFILMANFFVSLFTISVAQVQNDDVHSYPNLNSQNHRKNIRIPDIDGYKTLKCDFHSHTIFSDGKYWPDLRVKEAWNTGMDVIAITDHIEYRPNKKIFLGDHNESYNIAKKQGDEIGMMVIKGAEITRNKPLGHLNALFIEDANKLDVEDPLDAINEAVDQGAFILWNHPGWPDRKSTIYPIHKELIAENKIHGVELFNGWEAYPKVIDWTYEFNIAPFACSDIHGTLTDYYRGDRLRPMTLVFAKDYTVEGVKEALFAGRTVALYYNNLSGKEKFLKQLVKESFSIRVIDEAKGVIEMLNNSDITFEIQLESGLGSIKLFPNEVYRANIASGQEIKFTNCIVKKDTYLEMSLW